MSCPGLHNIFPASCCTPHHDLFLCDRYVSRDRNIVQFYGACVQENNLLLVAEMMEVLSLANPLMLLFSGALLSLR